MINKPPESWICVDPYIKALTKGKEYHITIQTSASIFSYIDDNNHIHKIGINWLNHHFRSKTELRCTTIDEILDL